MENLDFDQKRADYQENFPHMHTQRIYYLAEENINKSSKNLLFEKLRKNEGFLQRLKGKLENWSEFKEKEGGLMDFCEISEGNLKKLQEKEGFLKELMVKSKEKGRKCEKTEEKSKENKINDEEFVIKWKENHVIHKEFPIKLK